MPGIKLQNNMPGIGLKKDLAIGKIVTNSIGEGQVNTND